MYFTSLLITSYKTILWNCDHIPKPHSLCKLLLAYPKQLYVYLKINMCFTHIMTLLFLNLLCLSVSHVTSDCHCDYVMWCDCLSNPLLSSKNRKEENIDQKKNKNGKEKETKWSLPLSTLTSWGQNHSDKSASPSSLHGFSTFCRLLFSSVKYI